MIDINGDGTIDVNEFKAILPKEVTNKKVGKEYL